MVVISTLRRLEQDCGLEATLGYEEECGGGRRMEVKWAANVSASPTRSKVGNSTGEIGKGSIYKAGKRHRFQRVYMINLL